MEYLGFTYVIHPKTMALVPFYNEKGEVYTEIYESDQVLVIENKPLNIVKDSCYAGGSTYTGRVDGTTKLMNYTKMQPIVINDVSGIVVFPLESPNNEMCIWLSHHHIGKVIDKGPGYSTILFKNGKALPVPFSKDVVEIKILRAGQYRMFLFDRLTSSQKFFYMLHSHPLEVL
ncbi:competence protein ComK [Scopulibacillus daqui]|uniref:Competence protein ComK n=1 Tax=Scopulibacillus daqui TaxID=1469162 RepID=A0ABS2Q269_9BACL|nr:competence protein ComK [Scopulibacillus daqui]